MRTRYLARHRSNPLQLPPLGDTGTYAVVGVLGGAAGYMGAFHLAQLAGFHETLVPYRYGDIAALTAAGGTAALIAPKGARSIAAIIGVVGALGAGMMVRQMFAGLH